MRSIWGLSMGAILINFEKVVPKKLKLKTVKTNRRDDTLPPKTMRMQTYPPPKNYENANLPPKLYPILHLPS